MRAMMGALQVYPKEGTQGAGDNVEMTANVGSTKKMPQSALDSLNIPQGKDENKASLEEMGGIAGLMGKLGVDPEKGYSQEDVGVMRVMFGTNEFPESPMDSFLSLLWEACMDTTLLILLAAATVSLIIGVIEEPDGGWIEGAAIYIAVVLVANIGAGNDYSKQLQFKALEASSAEDERCSVFRDESIERINPKDLVVGDIIVLQVREEKSINTALCLIYARSLC
jgi:magnesium-transporting ATPase (P-type)